MLKSWQEGGGDNTDEPKAVSWGEEERHRFWVLERGGDHGMGLLDRRRQDAEACHGSSPREAHRAGSASPSAISRDIAY